MIIALPLMVAADTGPFGAEQTYPELLGGPDNPPQSTNPDTETQKPDPNREMPNTADVSSKPWRSINVDIPTPEKPRQVRKAGKQEPRHRAAKRKTIATGRPSRPAPRLQGRCAEPRYRIEARRVMVEPERVVERIRPARYKIVREQVVVRPDQRGTLVYPAQYRTVQERILVRPTQRRIVRVPALYREEMRRVAVTGPRRGWVREQLVRGHTWVPAILPPVMRFQLIRVPVAPARTAVVVEPAVYEVVARRVLVSPERREKVALAPEFETVTRRVLVEPARMERVTLPARFETVRRKVAASSGWTIYPPLSNSPAICRP